MPELAKLSVHEIASGVHRQKALDKRMLYWCSVGNATADHSRIVQSGRKLGN